MSKSLREIVDDYYKNSPDWPLPKPPNTDDEVDAFMASECGWGESEVQEAIELFWDNEE